MKWKNMEIIMLKYCENKKDKWYKHDFSGEGVEYIIDLWYKIRG